MKKQKNHVVSFFLLRTTFSNSIFASINGESSTICSWVSPCNFESAKSILNEYDYIRILDESISLGNDLIKFSNFVSFAVSLNCIISGDDTVINGQNFNSSNHGFIFANVADESKISNFKFSNFHSTILFIKSIIKFSVSHCYFFSNKIESSYGMILSSHGSFKIRDCHFNDNFFNGAHCIETYTSQFYIKKSSFSNNVIETPFSILFYSINSIIELNNLTFTQISSIHSPLFKFEYRTYLTMVNVVFLRNFATEIINCDGACNSALKYVDFYQNTGIIFKATSNSPIVVLKWCQMESNSAGDNPLFDLKNGHLFLTKPCKIIKNHAYCFVDFHNSYSQFSVSNCIFEKNNMNSHFAYISHSTTAKIFGAVFSNNIMPKGILIGDNVKLKIHIVSFKKNIGQPIYCQNCSSSVYLTSFIDCNEPALVLTGQDSKKSQISSSQFLTSAPNNQNVIYVNSSICSMKFLRFSQPRAKAFPQGCSYLMCEFNQNGKGMYLKETFFISGSCIFIIIIIIITDCFGLIRSFFF